MITPILTQRGILNYNHVTTDDETMTTDENGILSWSPITGISVEEDQPFVDVRVHSTYIRCSYDQRWHVARRTQSGYGLKRVVSTIPDALSQDRLIFSGSYLEPEKSILSSAEARLLALLVAGLGVTEQGADGTWHITFTASTKLPSWFLRSSLEGIETRVYGKEWVVHPNKSSRMARLMKRPLWTLAYMIDPQRREDFLEVFFMLPVKERPNAAVSLMAFMCNQKVDLWQGGYGVSAGTQLLQHAEITTQSSGSTWRVTTEAGGWTAFQGGYFMCLPE